MKMSSVPEEPMKQPTWNVHRGMLAVGVMLFVGGLFGALNPRQMMFEHPAHAKRGIFPPSTGPEMLTEKATLVYGLMTAAVGVLVVRFAISKKSA